MNTEIMILSAVQCLMFVTQVVVLLVQYKINGAYRGISWWVRGSVCMSLGVLFMPMVIVEALLPLAKIANPLLVLGQIFLYIGVMRFLQQKENRLLLGLLFLVFTVFYYYFMYGGNQISYRTITVHAALMVICFMTAYSLLVARERQIAFSANFTAVVFLVYSCFSLARVALTAYFPPMQDYSDQRLVFIIWFIVPVIFSTLWTFGFILMFNQRLHVESKENEEKYLSILNASPDDITITDMEGFILMVSPVAKPMFGYEKNDDEMISRHIFEFIIPEDRERAKANISMIKKDASPRPNEYLGLRKDQSIFNIEVNSGLISDSDGQVTKMVFVIRDITERKQAEKEIGELVRQLEAEKNTAQLNSITDSLTGLANRRYFDETLASEFKRLKRSGELLSVIMIDVDFFKKYNDNYGHPAGDACLRNLGNMLHTIVGRVPDFVARYGGEEFVVILPETDARGAATIAERIHKAVGTLAIPHAASSVSDIVTVSTGVVTVSTAEFSAAEQIVMLADEALYRAKANGRNRIEAAGEEEPA